MKINLPKKVLIGAGFVVAVGILLGAFFATKKDVSTVSKDPVPSSTAVPVGSGENFGAYFTSIFFGRSGDASKIKSNTPLVRSTKFYVGEKAGVRVQTTAELTNPVTVEVRFLKADTSEETSELKKMRQNINIKPGLRSYCCIAMPKEAGNYSAQVVLNGAFLGSISNLTILPARQIEQGGFLAL